MRRNFYKKELKNKLNAYKVTIDGMTFASKKEARRWFELKAMQDRGEICDLRFQVPYELIPNQYEEITRVGKSGKALKPLRKIVERKCEYIADFVYTKDGETIVEDTKGCRIGAIYQVFVIKRKLMLYRHGIKVKEV